MKEETKLTIEKIWHDSPLVPSEIEQIIAAAGEPIRFPDPEQSTVPLTLAYIAGSVFKLSLLREVSETEWGAVRLHFVGLVKALNQIQFVLDKPPYMPSEWGLEMHTWLEKGPPKKRKRGRPADQLDRIIFPPLLAFFEVVYGQRATASADGPCELFLTEFFALMLKASKKASWMIKVDEIPRPDPSKSIRVTKDDRVRNRIAQLRDGLNLELMRELLAEMATIAGEN